MYKNFFVLILILFFAVNCGNNNKVWRKKLANDCLGIVYEQTNSRLIISCHEYSIAKTQEADIKGDNSFLDKREKNKDSFVTFLNEDGNEISGTRISGFNNPSKLAISNGKLIVPDNFAIRIYSISDLLKLEKTIDIGKNTIVKVLINKNGTIFVFDGFLGGVGTIRESTNEAAKVMHIGSANDIFSWHGRVYRSLGNNKLGTKFTKEVQNSANELGNYDSSSTGLIWDSVEFNGEVFLITQTWDFVKLNQNLLSAQKIGSTNCKNPLQFAVKKNNIYLLCYEPDNSFNSSTYLYKYRR